MRPALILAVAGIVLAAATVTADAQDARHELPRRASPPPPAAPNAARPRMATVAEYPPAPAPAPAPVFIAPPVYYVTDGYILTGAPYLALSDGSVLVNFGSGYERVIRPCAPPAQTSASDPWARDALGRIPDPPGIAAIKAGARGRMHGTMPARSTLACYRVDAQGRPAIVTVMY